MRLTSPASSIVLAASVGVIVVLGCSSSGSQPSAPADSGAADTGTVKDSTPADTKSDAPADTGKADTGSGTDTSSGPCDPIAQTGCSAPDTKCTAVDDGSGSGKAGCVTPTGSKGLGDSCTRTSQDPSGIGHDDCGAGFFCSGISTLASPPNRHCRKFCKDDSKCASTEKCSELVFDGGTTATAGICVPTCTLFGTDCAGSLNCSVLITSMDGTTAHGTCRAVGTKAVGDKCAMAFECGKDMVCADPTKSGSNTCIALCDTSHTCSTGTCKAVGSLPSGGGVCQ